MVDRSLLRDSSQVVFDEAAAIAVQAGLLRLCVVAAKATAKHRKANEEVGGDSSYYGPSDVGGLGR